MENQKSGKIDKTLARGWFAGIIAQLLLIHCICSGFYYFLNEKLEKGTKSHIKFKIDCYDKINQ